jgi:transcription initiation factor TFIIIB Brf1 subunit/transcription initiation factor TFIIB
MEKCEKCGKRKRDVFRRAEHGKMVCSKCHQEILRSGSPTGLVRRPQYFHQKKESPSSED